MALVIQPYRTEHEAAVQSFNGRLQVASGDPNYVFSQSSVPRWLAPANGNTVWNEFYVAVDGASPEGSVRGVYALKQEALFVRGKGTQRIACYHHPLSEGIIDRAFTSVGMLLARDALARQPFLYALGMGGAETPIAKMLKALGFALTPIPFYFRVVHPAKFLREMQALRERRSRALLMDIAAASGAGWIAIKAMQAMKSSTSGMANVAAEEVGEFSEWIDELWSAAKETASAATVRDARTLKLLYPKNYSSPIASTRRLRITRNGSTIGWAIIGIRRKDAKFGTMRVGSIVDCWAMPNDANAVMGAATRALEKDGADLIVSNQSHNAWCNALEKNGFLKGPTNFVLATSKKLTELLQPLDENRASLHITRADGDGLPVNF
ncbi:MAG TPA: hypothetical protein VMT67_16955 [Terriglobales bacterium]|nr:hypothetical protein [Terriglobales bacterium]